MLCSFELLVNPELRKRLAMLLGSLDRFVEHRTHMDNAVILLRQWKFAKGFPPNEKKKSWQKKWNSQWEG